MGFTFHDKEKSAKMSIFLIILSCLLWGASFVALFKRLLLAPGLSYLALVVLSMAQKDGNPLLPVNNVILISWLAITVIVMLLTLMQPPEVRSSTRGMGYLAIGAFAGLAVGLLGFSVAESVSMRYSIMVVATAAGTFLGYLMYHNTPSGRNNSVGFLSYLLAKGFPTAITIMQAGVPLVLLLAIYAN